MLIGRVRGDTGIISSRFWAAWRLLCGCTMFALLRTGSEKKVVSTAEYSALVVHMQQEKLQSLLTMSMILPGTRLGHIHDARPGQTEQSWPPWDEG